MFFNKYYISTHFTSISTAMNSKDIHVVQHKFTVSVLHHSYNTSEKNRILNAMFQCKRFPFDDRWSDRNDKRKSIRALLVLSLRKFKIHMFGKIKTSTI